MGRGRQQAKQTKVARELKYHNAPVDVTALQRELSGYTPPPPRSAADDDEDDDDPYAAYAAYNDDDSDDSDDESSDYVSNRR